MTQGRPGMRSWFCRACHRLLRHQGAGGSRVGMLGCRGPLLPAACWVSASPEPEAPAKLLELQTHVSASIARLPGACQLQSQPQSPRTPQQAGLGHQERVRHPQLEGGRAGHPGVRDAASHPSEGGGTHCGREKKKKHKLLPMKK